MHGTHMQMIEFWHVREWTWQLLFPASGESGTAYGLHESRLRMGKSFH